MKRRIYFSLSSSLFLVVLLQLWSISVSAQAPTISYPSVAQDITRNYGQSNLTVKLVFNAICTGTNTVRIALPASVTYVTGSVAKAGGTASVNIAESNITNLSRPEFSISGISAVGDEITFTVARKADCGTLATAKDSVYFISGAGCSNASELSGIVNTYNIFAPVLSLTPAAPMTGAVIGTTATRTTTITNGGNGGLDTLHFYVVYPAGGIVNTNSNYAVSANSVSFDTVRKSGDTLFYKIYGATLFGGDAVLTTGETVTIQEPMRIVKCNTLTTYASGWGKNSTAICQWAAGTSTLTMASGVPVSNVTAMPIVQGENQCQIGIYQVRFKNTASGNIAAAMYNVMPGIGSLASGLTTPIKTTGSETHKIDSFKVGSVTVPVASIAGRTPYIADISTLTADPDGAGVGLDDIDGDGQFDDLAPGKEFVITIYTHFPPTVNCTGAYSWSVLGANVGYSTMCGTVINATNSGIGATDISAYVGLSDRVETLTKPSMITGGTPFTVTFSSPTEGDLAEYKPTDSVYLKIVMPPGVTLVGSGSPTNLGVAVPASRFRLISGVVDTIIYAQKGLVSSDLSFNVVYDCNGNGSGPKVFYYTYTWVADVNCPSVVNWHCASDTVLAVCYESPCPLGPINYQPVIERTTLGWTDSSMATRVLKSAVNDLALRTVIPYDSIRIVQSAKQNGSVNNLWYEYTISKPTATLSALQYINASLNYTKGGITNTYSLGAPIDSSTSSLTHYYWDLSAYLPGGSTTTNDSAWITINYVANDNALFGTVRSLAPVNKGKFFNYSSPGVKEYCTEWIYDLYFNAIVRSISPVMFGGSNMTTSGCAATNINTGIIARHQNKFDLFPEEYRPIVRIDSVKWIYPTGYVFNTVGLPQITYTYRLYPGQFNQQMYTKQIAYNFSDSVLTVPFNAAITPSDFDFNNSASEYMLFGFQPTCAASASATGKRAVFYYTKNLHVPAISSKDSVSDNSLPATITNTSLPGLAAVNNTGTIQGTQANHYWDVQVNSTGTQTAPYVWMALEKGSGSGGILIDSVKLMPSGTIINPTSTYNGTDTWYQLSTVGLAPGANQQARVFFHYTVCSLDSVLFKVGWNCSAYPNVNPDNSVCVASTTYLKLDPQTSQIQMSVQRQPGGGSSINLCTVDSTVIIVNSAMAANLKDPYITFYPPDGLNLVTPVQVEYPRGSGDYQAATVTNIGGGGYKIDLGSHTGIGGAQGILGTASANPGYSPLGGDREAKVVVQFSTDCSYTSGISFKFNAYGSLPCGQQSIGNGVGVTTSALNITGASATGSAGISMDFGGATNLSCDASATINMTTTPTSVPTQIGDTVIYTLPAGLQYAGNFVKGANCASCEINSVTVGDGITILKVKLQTGVSSGTALSYSFDVLSNGGGCGSLNIDGVYKRDIAPLTCGATPCASSSVIIANGVSPAIILNKPSLTINSVNKLDNLPSWEMGGATNIVRIEYVNNGSLNYTANSDTVEFFCNSTETTPFYKAPLSKNVAMGAAGVDTFEIVIPNTACNAGEYAEIRIQTTTAGGTRQCLCSPSSFIASTPLPLGLTDFDAQVNLCSTQLTWGYDENATEDLKSLAVQRSSDGKKFETVTTLQAGMQSYMDITPYEGKWFYRLRAEYVNGRLEYSPVLIARTVSCKESKVEIYPNPAQNYLQIVLQGESQHNRYVLMDALGRKILTGDLEQNHNNRVDVQQLSAGAYMLQVYTDNQVSTQKVQILR